jgi:hypothetical protein
MPMRRWLLTLALLLWLPTGALAASTGTLSAVDDAVSVIVSDRAGAAFAVPDNTLNGTVLPEVHGQSCVATTGWQASVFVAPSGAVSLSYIGGGSNSATALTVAVPAGAVCARARLSALTSGEVAVTLSQTTQAGFVFGSDGTSPRIPKISSAGVLDINCVTGCAGSGGTSMTDDAAFTVGTTTFTPVGGTYKSTLDSVDDNDGGAFAMTIKRFLYTTIGTPAGESAMDDTNDAVRTTPVTTVTIGGQSATSTTLPYPNGAGNLAAFIRPATATTTLWITGEASEHIYVTSMLLHASGTQGVLVVSGTGATCGTGTETVLGEVELSTANGLGFTMGNGNGMVLRTKDAGDSLCITTDSATALNALATYAIY